MDAPDQCVPAACAEDACGAVQDGCGGVLDCGPCSSARCPRDFEILFPDVLNPARLVYEPVDDALFYLDANGSNRVWEWRIGLEDEGRQIRQSGAVKGYATTRDAVYLWAANGTFRVRRRGRELGSWQERFDIDGTAIASHGDDVWFTTTEPAALWHVRSPSTRYTSVSQLTGSPRPNLLAADATSLWWVEASAGTHTLKTRARTELSPTADVFRTQQRITQLITWSEGVCVAVESETSTTLWCTPSKQEPLRLVSTWAPSFVFDLDALDDERVIVARTLGDGYNRGWQVSTVSPGTQVESVRFSVPTGGDIAPGIEPVTTDGTCLYLSYQNEFRVQRDQRGAIGWLRLDAAP